MKKQTKTPATILVMPDNGWRDRFRASSVKVGFVLTLTKPMMEYICAVADDVYWDRSICPGGLADPDSWYSTQGSLFKRGLIQRKPEEEIKALYQDQRSFAEGHPATYRLTPAGIALVELLKVSGLFVQADAAINKKKA